MNAKTLTFLIFSTILVVIAAVMLTQPQNASSDKIKLFPRLMSTIVQVTEINIITKDESITIIRSDEQWLLKEKDNYPIASGKVNKLLLGVADLTILEAKTSNPHLYSKIGVEDVSTRLFLKNADEIVASLIVGNNKIAKTDSTRSEIYVRKSDEKQAWLTFGRLPIEKTPIRWLDRQIINLDNKKIRQVRIIHPDGESFLIFKDNPEDETYQIANLPINATIKEEQMLNSIVSTLNHLDFDDVTKIEFDDKVGIQAIFTTFDVLEVTMIMMEKDGKYYAKFSAGEDAKLKGWVYELAKYKVEHLEKKRDELINIEKLPVPFNMVPEL